MTTVITNYPNCPCCSSSSKSSSSRSSSSRSSSSGSSYGPCTLCGRSSYTLTTSGSPDARFNGVFVLSNTPFVPAPTCATPAFQPCVFAAGTTFTSADLDPIYKAPPFSCSGSFVAVWGLILTGSLGAFVWTVILNIGKNPGDCTGCNPQAIWQNSTATCTPPTSLAVFTFGAWGPYAPSSLALS